MNQLYTPSFQPIILGVKNLSQRSLFSDKNKDKEKSKNLNKQNVNTISCNLIKTNPMEVDKDIDEFDYPMHLNNIIRERIFSKTKKNARYKSAMKFNIIDDEKVKNYGLNNEANYYYNDENDSFNRNQNQKLSSSFVIRKKKKINY